MTVKKYVAANAREALRRAKQDIGADAIVVSNRAVAEGVEIVAMSADSLDALSRQPSFRPAAPQPTASAPQSSPANSARAVSPEPGVGDDYTVSLSGKARAQAPFRPWQPAAVASTAPATAVPERPRMRPLPERATSEVHNDDARKEVPLGDAERLRGYLDQGTPPGRRGDVSTDQLLAEMHAIKSLLERQLGGFAWGDLARESPARAMLLAEMLDAGFSGELARHLIEGMPPDLSAEAGRKWLLAGINRRLRTLASDSDIIDRGGVFALVGPTGVGKTTTTAKLAARCVVRYGADRLALLTTDSYRIGAHEQLRIYGRILGVPVHVVRDSDDLRRTLHELRDKHMVLIDTVGMSQRDRMVAEQAAMLMRAGEVSRILLLNATSRGDTLDDVIRSYAGEDLAGTILTKIDEAASLAPALDAVVRHGLLLTHVANGQRVPEDLHLPNRSYLLHRAFKLPAVESPHRLREEEVGLSLPQAKAGGLRASLV
ncbi:MAG: flagellar biosynthesis protein FlhF [Sulfurisoma sp.]|nr:flagellar biosynthesis protein FlhF [Sulfurisoma sp.]